MKFNRTEGVLELINNLKNEPLYNDYLFTDSDVFMAFRNNEIHFYYGGSKLFGYTKNGFESHKKYCFNPDTNKEYIRINELENIKPKFDYKLIKENAKNYAGIEALGVSNLYKYNFKLDDNYILLDTEIAFYDAESKDRVDLLLFDKENKELKFIEAKHFSNSELWTQENSKPVVTEQIKRYKNRIENCKESILKEYRNYVNLINNSFDLSLPLPEKICTDVSLYMFGFDNDQKEKIKKLLKEDDSLEGINYYFKGDSKNINLATLYKSIKN